MHNFKGIGLNGDIGVRLDIQAAANARQIPYLVHFTRSENLPSILQHGLKPREDIDKNQVNGNINDHYRNDHRTDRNCLSIGFPNFKMFFKLRNEIQGTEWPILFIHPAALWRLDCLFCHSNAANACIASTSDEDLASLQSFNKLFEDDPNAPTRAAESLRMCDPTDVQAEVLIKGTIPPEYIFAVAFQSIPDKEKHFALCGQKQTFVSSRRAFYGQREYALRNRNVT